MTTKASTTTASSSKSSTATTTSVCSSSVAVATVAGACGLTSTPPTSPSSIVLSIEQTQYTEQQRKAAAAAAARRKRRKALVRRSSRNRQKRIKTTHHVPQVTEITKRPLTRLSPPVMIQPTVSGIQEVATKLSEGKFVAVPTECTYEVVAQLDWQESSSWSERMQLLYSLEPDREPPSNSVEVNNKNTPGGDDELFSPISTDSNGNSDNGRNYVMSSGFKATAPHIYVHQYSLDGLFWRKCLPKRPYAVRNKEGEVLAAHAFNETQQVLRLLASKIWPGPVLIYVAVERLVPGLTVTRHGKHFLGLRSLCHPLMVKVHQEYQTSQQVPLQSKESNSNDIVEPLSPSYGNRCPRSPGSSSRSTKDVALLVGLALQDDRASYVTKAAQVGPDKVVLNGEDTREIFAVPPCEYGKPCPHSLWLDSSRRLVILSNPGGTAATHFSSHHLLQVLRNRKPPKTDKDRVIQAVLNKWNVIEETADM